MHPLNLNEYEILAGEKISSSAYDYYRGGADEEITLKENRSAFKKIFLKYRVLRDVSKVDLSTGILGTEISMPVLIAPTAFHKMAHPDGEIAVAKAASAEDTIMVLSTFSNSDMEEVVKANGKNVWFQLYVYKDREVTRELIHRAKNAGMKAIVLTVDAPYIGHREKDMKNKFSLPEHLSVKNLLPSSKEKFPVTDKSGLAEYVSKNLDPSLSWKDIDWIKSVSDLPLIIKGIGCKEDASISVDCGVDGLIVSNHGGRQLDTCRATIDVLPEVAEAAGSKTEILIDGGIRKGTDVIKALALGAKAVLIGRPVIWGLACSGEKGVRDVLNILKYEIILAMALCGINSVNEIDKSFIA